MTVRIPEIQKLKDRIIELPDLEIDELRIWLNAVVDVKRQLSRPKPVPQVSLKGTTDE